MPRVNDREVVRITGANPGLGADVRTRQRRYLISMAVRTVAFVAAVALLRGWARWLGVVVAVVLPWFAVVIANVGRSSRVVAPLQPGSNPARTLTAGAAEPDRRTVTVPGTARSGNGEPSSSLRTQQSPEAQITDTALVDTPQGPVHLTGSRRN